MIRPAHFYTVAGIAGSCALAAFEYFGLVSESMETPYKVFLGLGIGVVSIAYFKASRGKFFSLLLCPFLALPMLTSSFSGRAQISVQQEKAAMQNIGIQQKLVNLESDLSDASKLAIEHKTIKNNNDIFNGRLTAIKELKEVSSHSTLTNDERYATALSALSGIGIDITASQFATYLSALFTLALFVSSGICARAGLSRHPSIPQGDQDVTIPASSSGKNQDKVKKMKTTYTDEEIKTAFNWKVASDSLSKMTNNDGHIAIKEFYHSDVSAGNDRVSKLVKEMNLKLSGMKKEGKPVASLGWKIFDGLRGNK